jgi:hypothetical protein
MEQLQISPEGVGAIQQAIAQMDASFLNGFVGGQRDGLAALPHIFARTPLEKRVRASLDTLARNEFSEASFLTLAAARVSLQGILHDLLRNQALVALGRTSHTDNSGSTPDRRPQSSALFDSTRHWLMELALSGFARLEPGTLFSFLPTLSQLRTCPDAFHLNALLTGFLNEILAAIPIKEAGQVPLLRWCDLWSVAMLSAVGIAPSPPPFLVSGTLYPLGVDLHQHAQAASLVVYSILVTGDRDERALFVRQSWSAFKVSAIRGDELWLLFPEAQRVLQSLMQSKALNVTDMPLLPSGDLLWNDDNAEAGKKYKPLDIALQYCRPGSSLETPTTPALERHPVQISEPVALTNFQVEEDKLTLKDDLILPLDPYHTGFSPETLADSDALFGLLRYNAGQWMIQPLIAGAPKGKFEFAGQAGAELLNKPPKTSTVSILKERSSRLLRR